MELRQARDQLAHFLRSHSLRIVFAESCTAGLCSATLGQVDGISNHLCGSLVVYRAASKIRRLQIPSELIEQFGCESVEVAEALALRVLSTEPEADWSASVVGHLAEGQEPFVVIGIARRDATHEVSMHATHVIGLQAANRESRQQEATALVLRYLAAGIESHYRQ